MCSSHQFLTACHVPSKVLGHSLPVALQRPRLLKFQGGGYQVGAGEGEEGEVRGSFLRRWAWAGLERIGLI